MTASNLERRAAELLAELVAIPSVTPRDAPPHPGAVGEADVAAFVASWLSARGVDVTVHEALPGRPNVVAVVPGAGPGPGLLLETHLDTVEVVDMTAPFAPRVEDGRLYGRGAADAKGSLAGFMLLLEDLAAAPTPPPVSVTLAAVADEEHSYRGVVALIERTDPEQYLGAVVGEPTGLALGIAHTGCVRATVTVHGAAGHSSRPADALNAVTLAVPLIERLAQQPEAPVHPLLGSGARSVTRIYGGEGPNVIPGSVELDFDRRLVPGEEPFAVLAELSRELEALQPGRVSVSDPFTVDFALDTDPDAVVVRALGAGLRLGGRDGDPVGLPFGSDASKIGRAGIPAVVCGPGDIADAHTVTESIELTEIADFVTALSAAVHELRSVGQA